VYRDISFIWSVENLSPISTVKTNVFADTLPSEGIYYYVIVAENFAGKSLVSNCQYIEYKLPTLQEYFIISGIITTVLVLSIAIYKIKMKKSKQE
jgi:hypothetical protein